LFISSSFVAKQAFAANFDSVVPMKVAYLSRDVPYI
jgi:hypothetical protein